MRNINLLPRKPLVDKIFVPVLAGSVLFFTLAATSFTLYSFQVERNIDDLMVQSQGMKNQIHALLQARQPDPITNDYNAFLQEVNHIKSKRIYWNPLLTFITNQLPELSRLVSISVETSEKITVNLEFVNLDDTAQYVAMLQQSALLEQVTVKHVKQFERPKTIKNPLALTAPTVNKEEMLKSFLEKNVTETDESGKLLQQLDWIVAKEAVKEQYNVDIPSPDPLTEQTDFLSTHKQSPFSTQDIDQAYKALDQLKKQNNVSNIPDIVTNETVNIYQVQLEMKLKTTSQKE